jgi:Cu/Ag efflux protein CusF
MKTQIVPPRLACLFLPAVLLFPSCSPADATKSPASPPSSTTSAPAAERHPLKGVVVEIRAGQSSLLVKHEDIPGFMPAMTMLFKVDAATLQTAVKGQAITGTLVQRDDGFWLEDVHPAPAR